MLNELRWSIDGIEKFDAHHFFLELRPGVWIDPHLVGYDGFSIPELVQRRHQVQKVFKAIDRCRIVIITLGLAEAWFDKQTNLYLNMAPPRDLVRQQPGRFDLHVLDVASLRAAMEDLIELLRSRCPPGLRILLTVSPVPLNATYRNEDVLTANMYSKSVLRVVAEELHLKHEEIDYFPSYESVMLSNRENAFLDDLRHVRDDLVGLNVNRMMGAYVTSYSKADPDQLCRTGLSYNRQNRFAEALECFDAALEIAPGHLDSLRGSAASLRLLMRFDDAKARLQRVLAVEPTDAESLYLGALIEFQTRTYDEALRLLKVVIALDRRNAGSHYLMARCCIALKEWERGLTAIGEAVDLIPNHAGFRYWKSWLELQCGNPVAAEAEIKVALREKPEIAEYHHQDALVLLQRSRFADAEVAAEVALRLRPESAKYSKLLADIRSAQVS